MGSPKCPKCGSELLPVGYPDETGAQRYKCPNGCNFKPPLSWKIKNAVATVVILLVYLLFTLVAGVVWVARKILRR